MIGSVFRRKTKKIFVGCVAVGQNSPISIQTMTNTSTEDVKSTIDQIKIAEKAKADLVRVSVPTKAAAIALKTIIANVSVPIIADIHFNHKRAIESIKNGAHCIRINPGNIDNFQKKEIIKCAKDFGCAIRLGINSGSLEEDIMSEFSLPSVDALVKSAIRNVQIFEDAEFYNLKVSIKSSDVLTTIKSYRKLSERIDYPLHLGVTEAGPLFPGTVKSSICIGTLLSEGIGDTIRVSLSSSIVDEIKVGRQILKSLDLLENSVNIVSCPTCARTLINVIDLSEKINALVENINKKITISILGCVVNGIGEAKQSDIGIFGFMKGTAKIFLRKKDYATVNEHDIIATVEKLLEEF
jgi:(E)-4-hydroxy-3-methylbut-2-enyl-diphosphate synthase